MTPSQNNTIKKILVTGGKGMLAYDFFRSQKERYEIILTDREECDITSFESVLQCIDEYAPDVLLNCAAYTAVDDAEDLGMKLNYDVNTLSRRRHRYSVWSTSHSRLITSSMGGKRRGISRLIPVTP
jgi:dTDP-4-dehydrorhamnose reductase